MQTKLLKTVVLSLTLLISPQIFAKNVSVTNVTELLTAIQNVQPGDIISVSSGTYLLTQNIEIKVAGTKTQPIIVRGNSTTRPVFRFNTAQATTDGFRLNAPWWTFENLQIEDDCDADEDCEHAFLLSSSADFTTIRNCKLRGFNSPVRSIGQNAVTPATWADDVTIELNEFVHDQARFTTVAPVAAIAATGGARWTVRANHIYDISKLSGDQLSYAVIFNGGAENITIERNLIRCERFTSGQARNGVSLGSAALDFTGPCMSVSCNPRQITAIVRNNIIMRCPTGNSVQLDNTDAVRVYNNTLFDTLDLTIKDSSLNSEVRNNLLSANIVIDSSSQSTSTVESNLEFVASSDFALWFAGPELADFTLNANQSPPFLNAASVLSQVVDDFCKATRGSKPDIGAVEYSGQTCDTTRPFGGTSTSTNTRRDASGFTGSDGGLGGGGGGGGTGSCRCEIPSLSLADFLPLPLLIAIFALWHTRRKGSNAN